MTTFDLPQAETRSELDARALVASAKWAYTTRRIDLDRGAQLITDPTTAPRIGDVVLARITAVGQHKRIELQTGRRATLYPGDVVGLCYGSRYAPDQFLAEIPADIGPCHMAAAGGIAAQVELAHSAMGAATAIEPIGLLADSEGRRLNLRDAAIAPVSPLSSHRAPTIAVVGSSMNAGKTTTAAELVRGLRAAGLRVGAAKVTGTGAGGDVWLFTDSGADVVYDFTAAGAPSTFGLDDETIREIFRTLTTQLAVDRTDVNVIEVADGLYHEETAALITHELFRDQVDGVVFAARDALGAVAGVDWLADAGLPLLAVSGVLTASPLAMRELERLDGELPVVDTMVLEQADRALEVRDAALAARTRHVPGLAAIAEDAKAV
ncbi:DUF1611 domain-containing protein [Georgenia sp. Z1344]|uniref:DUF1611 domain-containing protein n=1 Tax=Georgenia sp. Z1344 TaxID=3416706 RepID=UPI003CE9B356